MHDGKCGRQTTNHRQARDQTKATDDTDDHGDDRQLQHRRVANGGETATAAALSAAAAAASGSTWPAQEETLRRRPTGKTHAHKTAVRKRDVSAAKAAAAVSKAAAAVSKAAAANADDHANAFTDQISDLGAINRRTEVEKVVSKVSSVGNAVREEKETTHECWQHCTLTSACRITMGLHDVRPAIKAYI